MRSARLGRAPLAEPALEPEPLVLMSLLLPELPEPIELLPLPVVLPLEPAPRVVELLLPEFGEPLLEPVPLVPSALLPLPVVEPLPLVVPVPVPVRELPLGLVVLPLFMLPLPVVEPVPVVLLPEPVVEPVLLLPEPVVEPLPLVEPLVEPLVDGSLPVPVLVGPLAEPDGELGLVVPLGDGLFCANREPVPKASAMAAAAKERRVLSRRMEISG